MLSALIVKPTLSERIYSGLEIPRAPSKTLNLSPIQSINWQQIFTNDGLEQLTATSQLREFSDWFDTLHNKVTTATCGKSIGAGVNTAFDTIKELMWAAFEISQGKEKNWKNALKISRYLINELSKLPITIFISFNNYLKFNYVSLPSIWDHFGGSFTAYKTAHLEINDKKVLDLKDSSLTNFINKFKKLDYNVEPATGCSARYVPVGQEHLINALINWIDSLIVEPTTDSAQV